MTRTVTTRDTLLPVLIECPPDWNVPLELGGRGRAPDGYVFSGEEGGTIPVRVLPWNFFSIWRGKRWEKLCATYGLTVSAKERVNLLALFRLSQAVQTGGLKSSIQADAQGRLHIEFVPSEDLKIYVKLQAGLRTRENTPVPTSAPGDSKKTAVQANEAWKQLLPTTGGHPVFELAQQVNRRTKSGRQVLWFSRREEMLRPGLYFSRIQDAIYALFALQIVQPQGVGICERCGKLFERSRVAQKVCSTRCGNYIRKKRERAKAKGGQHK